MAHKPAYDGVDAVFVNGGRFIHDLGIVYNSLGEYRKAEKLCEKGLLIREKVLGTEHPDTAMSYHNLVGIYDSQGEYKTALTYYLKSYKVFYSERHCSIIHTFHFFCEKILIHNIF